MVEPLCLLCADDEYIVRTYSPTLYGPWPSLTGFKTLQHAISLMWTHKENYWSTCVQVVCVSTGLIVAQMGRKIS